jgi:hypothetical protein
MSPQAIPTSSFSARQQTSASRSTDSPSPWAASRAPATASSSDADDDSSPDVSDDPEARAASEALQMLHRMKNE